MPYQPSFAGMGACPNPFHPTSAGRSNCVRARDRSIVMISYSATLYWVAAPERTAAFKSTCRNGLWHYLAKELPDHLGTEVLAHTDAPELILVLQFWSSTAAGVAVEASPMRKLLMNVLTRLARRSCHLGFYPLYPDESFDLKLDLSPCQQLFDDWRSDIR